MTTLPQATLTDAERRTLDRFAARLEEELGDELLSVWLYGSRARGEPVPEESDVDLIVVTQDAGAEARAAISHRLYEVAAEQGASPAFFSLHVYDPAYVARRRDIRSFFFQEVDRDKIVLVGDP